MASSLCAGGRLEIRWQEVTCQCFYRFDNYSYLNLFCSFGILGFYLLQSLKVFFVFL